jgi:hypothetical protein
VNIEDARKVERADIVVGNQYEFYAEMRQDYEPPEQRMRNYTGQTVLVVRPLNADESDWFEPYEENGELIEPEVSRGFIVRSDDGFEFCALEEELNGWDKDLGQFYNPDGTYGPDHEKH